MDMSSQPMLTDDDDAQPLITNRMTQAQPIIPQRASAMNKRRQSVAAIGVGAKIEVSLNIIKISFTHEVICAWPTNRKKLSSFNESFPFSLGINSIPTLPHPHPLLPLSPACPQLPTLI